LPGKYSSLIVVNEEYLIDKPVEVLIDVIFHEMVHFYCHEYKITDSKEKNGITYHNEHFRDAVRMFGGVCRYTDDVFGWDDAKLTKKTKGIVKESMRRYGI
jgi:predicted SprT family Zn-dependent metalloprotease